MDTVIQKYIGEYIDTVYEHEEEILKKYKGSFDAWEIIEVSITDTCIRYIILTHDGASIVDSISIYDFEKIKNKVKSF